MDTGNKFFGPQQRREMLIAGNDQRKSFMLVAAEYHIVRARFETADIQLVPVITGRQNNIC
jgi:hypothetical protein